MPLNHIRIVLVRPVYGGNVGSVCRAMMNMGLDDLAMVSPREGMDWNQARRMAYRADSVLDNLSIFDSLADAVAGCGVVAGTTVRGGLYRRHAVTPRDCARDLLNAADRGRAAMVFGPEDHGLSNEDIAMCTHLVRIPSSDVYPSLNLSQAVMVCCYELFMESGIHTAPAEMSPDASSELRERMFEMWREALLAIGFMEEDKARHMMLGLRRILSRGRLTEIDVRILMGIARQALWCAGRGKKEDSK